HFSRCHDGLPHRRVVARRAARAARAAGVRAVPVRDDVLLRSRRALVARFVGVDVVRKQGSPRVVWVVVHVSRGALRNACLVDGADVMRFAVVVPCDDLSSQLRHTRHRERER
ncbi:hypothetical protein T310_5904, partial [Rasamsonia emersonii CBS 393.64]